MDKHSSADVAGTTSWDGVLPQATAPRLAPEPERTLQQCALSTRTTGTPGPGAGKASGPRQPGAGQAALGRARGVRGAPDAGPRPPPHHEPTRSPAPGRPGLLTLFHRCRAAVPRGSLPSAHGQRSAGPRWRPGVEARRGGPGWRPGVEARRGGQVSLSQARGARSATWPVQGGTGREHGHTRAEGTTTLPLSQAVAGRLAAASSGSHSRVRWAPGSKPAHGPPPGQEGACALFRDGRKAAERRPDATAGDA